MAERAATLEELRAVRAALEDIDSKLDQTVAKKVKQVAVPREEYNRRVRRSGRRVAAALLILLLGFGFAVFWNRATLNQAQRQSERDIRTLITTCRASVDLTKAQLAYCERRIPGFGAARIATRQTAQISRQNEQRLETLERQVAKLEAAAKKR